METDELEDSPIQERINKGLILGSIHVFVFLILYYFLSNKLTGFSYLFFVIGLNVGYCIYYSTQLRKEKKGFISFGEVFKFSFLVLLFNGLLSSLVVPIIFSLIDEGFSQVYAESQIDTSIYWAEKLGAPESTLDQIREKMDFDKLTKEFQPLGIIKRFGFAIIFYAIGSVIMSFIVRRTEPEVM